MPSPKLLPQTPPPLVSYPAAPTARRTAPPRSGGFPPRVRWSRLPVQLGCDVVFRAAVATAAAERRRPRSVGALASAASPVGIYKDLRNPTLFFTAERSEGRGAGSTGATRIDREVRGLLQERPRCVELECGLAFPAAGALPRGAVLRVGRHRILPAHTSATVDAYAAYVTPQVSAPASGVLASAMYRGAGEPNLLYFFTWFRSRADLERHARSQRLVGTRARLAETLQERLEVWDVATAWA